MLISAQSAWRGCGCAVLLAGAGILVQLILLGPMPWIALILALSFGT